MILPEVHVSVASAPELIVEAFHVDAALGRPFRVELTVKTPTDALPLDELVGAPAAFTLGERRWDGLVREIGQVSIEDDSSGSSYAMVVVPQLWLLTQRTNNRIFQYRSEVDIALEILEQWGVEVDVELDKDAYKKRKYRVQYEESDFDFVHRMLEEVGVSYSLPSAGEKQGKLVVTDAPHTRPPAVRLTYTQAHNLLHEVFSARNVQVARRVAPGKLTLRDHDYRKQPSYPLLASATEGTALEKKLEVFEYREASFLYLQQGGAEDAVADARGKTRSDEEAARELAERRLAAQRADAAPISFAPNLVVDPGDVVQIDGHAYTHLASPGTLVTRTTVSGTRVGRAVIDCHAVSAAQPYRPPRMTPRPFAGGIESATVVGPEGEEIHVDEFGRVQVHFHWDRQSNWDDGNTCWMHVSQAWAGRGWGATMLPRIGQEVLVEFLGGDPDRPIVVGRVYTALQQTPYELPKLKTQSGFKTCSTGGTGGYNELMFEDRGGQELIRVQAERDYVKLVKNDETITVRNDRARTVGGSETITVAKSQSVRVQGSRSIAVKGDHATNVAGGSSYTTKGTYGIFSEGELSLGSATAASIGAASTLVTAAPTTTLMATPPAGGSAASITMEGTKIVLDSGAGASIALEGNKVTISAGIVEVAGGMVLINKANAWAAGRLNDAAPDKIMDGAATVFIGGPSISEFNANALKNADAMLQEMEEALLRWNADDQAKFEKWLGTPDEAGRQEMLERVRAAREKLKTATIVPAEGPDKNSVDAYVHGPNDDGIIHLGGAHYMTGNTRGQTGTIVHEVGHFPSVASTDDLSYNQAEMLQKAKTDPAWARKNSGNWAYWGMEYGNPTPVK